MQTILSDTELANYLRDGMGSAEVVAWATRIDPAQVHLIAQGFLDCSAEESQALRLAYQCCMWAPLAHGEQIADWLAGPGDGAGSPVSLIWSGNDEALAQLLS